MSQNGPISAIIRAFDIDIPAVPFSYSSWLSILATLTLNWVVMNYQCDKLASIVDHKTHFDFIVVGAGSAGSAAAYRLSENGRYSVLLLEAGGIPPPFITYPLLSPFNLHLETDWKYKTVPQNNSCFGTENQQMKWPRGKLLGGTSNLNWMLYVRGHPMDFNRWAELSGDEQWSYENLLPYFRRMEDYKGNFDGNNKFHGEDGPLCISKHDKPPLVSTWLKSGKEIGYHTGTDYNAYQKPGFYPIDLTICEGRRVSGYTAYIEPARKHENLKIYTFSHVTKIEINETTKRAIGVVFERYNETKTVFAKKEIILSAGAINTPQILHLSGIGPKEHLKSVGIKPIVDSPGVGGNLMDHVTNFFGPFVLNDTVSVMLKRNITVEAAAQYKNSKSGVIAYNFVSGGAFFSSSQATPLKIGNSSWPDAVLMFGTVSFADEDDGDSVAHFVGLNKTVFAEYVKPFLGKDAVWVMITVALPKSIGTIELNSKDPFDPPNIDPKYFDKPEDMKVMVEAMQFTVKLFETTKAWQKYDAKFSPGHKLERCKDYPEKSDAYFECFVRTLTMTEWHSCCTAKFGKAGDPLAVLNSNLSVIGVKGLRVADASAMPVITNANINTPCVMLGEKVSQLVLDQWENEDDDSEKGAESQEKSDSDISLIKSIGCGLGPLQPMEALDGLVRKLFK